MILYQRNLPDTSRYMKQAGQGMTSSVPPSMRGGAETPEEHVQRLLGTGELTQEQLDHAESLWRERLHRGISMPNGEDVHIERDDLYHILADERIRRRPERVEHLLRGVFEIRRAHGLRRRALSRWNEEGRIITGFAILEPDGRLRTMHVTSERAIQRYQRREHLLWPPSPEQP